MWYDTFKPITVVLVLMQYACDLTYSSPLPYSTLVNNITCNKIENISEPAFNLLGVWVIKVNTIGFSNSFNKDSRITR